MMEGRKDDADKVRLELFPSVAIFAISRVLTKGAIKYEDRGWEKGMKWSRVYGATLRHLFAWFAGRGPTAKSFLFGDLDDEWQFSHLWHAGCCIVFLISYEEWQIGEDDRPIQAAPKTVPMDDLLERALRRGLGSPPPVPARPGGPTDGSDGGGQ